LLPGALLALNICSCCCKDRDFCNRYLRPVIKYYAPSMDKTTIGGQVPSVIYEGAL